MYSTHFNTTKGALNVVNAVQLKHVKSVKLQEELLKKTANYNERNADCKHTDSARAITGLWTTSEIHVEKALEKGYKIVKIYDVWHFEQSSTDLC